MFERILFAARWLMVPFYLGLIVALLVILFKFVQELYHFILKAAEMTESNAIVGAAALIDLTLVASLILIVIFSGYENFVSSIDAARHPNWPEWMTRVDFTQLKQKLLASIVLISAIQVLKAFMEIDKYTDRELLWLVIVHSIFVLSGVAFAVSDKLSSMSRKKGPGNTTADTVDET